MMSLCLLRFAAILARTSSAVTLKAGLVGSIGGNGGGLLGRDGGAVVVGSGVEITGGCSTVLVAFLDFEKIAISADAQQRLGCNSGKWSV